jgi:hypothetical protein
MAFIVVFIMGNILVLYTAVMLGQDILLSEACERNIDGLGESEKRNG